MNTQKRIWEIDFIRGITIILMIIFHIIVVLRDFYKFSFEYTRGFWYFEGLISGVLFIITAGLSSTLSKNNLSRGLKIFGLGMLLTLITYIYNPSFYIKFGILHFLGISMILYHYLSKYNSRHLFSLSVLSLILGIIFSRMYIGSTYLFPLGLTNDIFSSLDFYPLLPWIGVFLFGSLLGRKLYFNKTSFLKWSPKYDVISSLGRFSLIIYLTHIPLIIAVLHLVWGK